MKKLIAYFSASGVTEKAAKQLAQITGADLHEIAPAIAYTQADLDWRDKKSRSTMEMTDPQSRPALAEEKTDLSAYDTVYIGFPIWWGVAPRVVNTFIDNNDMAGSSWLSLPPPAAADWTYAVKDLQKNTRSRVIKAGKLLNGSVTEDIL